MRYAQSTQNTINTYKPYNAEETPLTFHIIYKITWPYRTKTWQFCGLKTGDLFQDVRTSSVLKTVVSLMHNDEQNDNLTSLPVLKACVAEEVFKRFKIFAIR